MLATLFILLAGHLLGDFVLQTDWMVARKHRRRVLLLHAGLVTGVTLLLLGLTQSLGALLVFAVVLFVSHALIDAAKLRWLPDRASTFLLDQLAHLLVLVALAAWYPRAAHEGWWLRHLAPEVASWYLQGITFVIGLLLCVPAGGALIGKAVRDLVDTDEQLELQGLPHGGRYIGWLERALVLLLVLINQHSGIGFLFAAKSILRFGEIREPDQRKVAEYIIIGTFLSFGWALLIATLLVKALSLWTPAQS